MTFRNCQQILIGAWVYGTLTAIDAPITLWYLVGDLHDIDLTVSATIDKMAPYAAINIAGPTSRTVRCPDTPEGTFYKLPYDIRVSVDCARSPAAASLGKAIAYGLGVQGGLMDSGSISVTVSGTARAAMGFLGPRHPNFVAPQIISTAFTPLT